MNLVIIKISGVHGEYPGSVDVSFHYVDDCGTRDGFESARISLTDSIIKSSGEIDQDEVNRQVISKLTVPDLSAVETFTPKMTYTDHGCIPTVLTETGGTV